MNLLCKFGRRIAAVAVVLAGVAGSSGTADAAFNGTLGFAPFGGTVVLIPAGSQLDTATHITLPGTEVVNLAPTGDFMGEVAVGDAVSIVPLTIPLSPFTTPLDITIVGSIGAMSTFEFFTTSGAVSAFSVGGFSFANFAGVGTFYVDGVLVDSDAELSFSASKSSLTADPNISFTLTVATAAVPEPMSLTLAGLAIAGFGARTLRRKLV